MRNVVIAGCADAPFHLADASLRARVRGDDIAVRTAPVPAQRLPIADPRAGRAFPGAGPDRDGMTGLPQAPLLPAHGVTANRFRASSRPGGALVATRPEHA